MYLQANLDVYMIFSKQNSIRQQSATGKFIRIYEWAARFKILIDICYDIRLEPYNAHDNFR